MVVGQAVSLLMTDQGAVVCSLCPYIRGVPVAVAVYTVIAGDACLGTCIGERSGCRGSTAQ